jgi:isopenicillin N synthase-like dioxygenase
MKTKFLLKTFSQVVKIDFNQLLLKNNSALNDSISKAYGKEGLGILIIQNVPKLNDIKSEIFADGHKLVNLPKADLVKLERPEHNYAFGWSYGKEYFGEKPDFYKASYYANLENIITGAEHKDNIWPGNEIPQFKHNFYALGNLTRSIGLKLLEHIDSYIKSLFPLYKLNYPQLINESNNSTGRLLYYYPRNKMIKTDSNEVWCDWHNDHSSLTGLSSASFINEYGNPVEGLSLSKTGLYIQGRDGKEVRVTFGKNDMAFQVGETLQIHSGGLLHATPHAVRVFDDMPGSVARCTFALFMAPNREVMLDMPEGCNAGDITTSEIYKVPKIQHRFKIGMNYGEFNDETYKTFYNKN